MKTTEIATREEVELSLSIMSYGLDTVRSALTDAKKNISELLTNKNVPLETRWNFFVKYGDMIGNTKSWVCHFDVEKKLIPINLKDRADDNYVGEISWYDDFYKERGNTIIMHEIIEGICDSMDRFMKKGWTPELVDEFKEEILANNLYSFTYDW